MILFLNYFLLLNLISPLLCLSRGVFKSELKNKPKSFISLDTDLGTIIGYKQNVNVSNIVDKTINVFYGIPYSDGRTKRFRKAKLINKFPNEIYLALSFKPHCPRPKEKRFPEEDKYSEDCLYLNIWTPNIQKIDGKCTKRYNVMVKVLGQESIFIMSSFPDHDGDGLLSHNHELFTALHNIIVVTISNRQGVFNSLYLDGELPGNLMLFDQNLAIQWVKKNIKDYCGNDKITLFGNSLSSQTVQAHLLSSKYSKYLIDNAILQSYSIFVPTESLINRDELMINSMLIINQLGCLNRKLRNDSYLELLNNRKIINKYFYYNSELKIEKYLNDLNSNWNLIKFTNDKPKFDENLIELTKFLSRYAVNLNCLEDIEMIKVMEINLKYSDIGFYMYFDDDFFDKDAYLNYKLFNELDVNPNVSILAGGLIDERCELGIELKNKFYADKFNIIIPKNDAKEIIKNSFKNIFKDKSEMADCIANYYTDLNKNELHKGFYDAISNYFNDFQFNCPLIFHSEFYSKKSKNLFNYIISYKFVNHLITRARNYTMNDFEWINSCHADETIYLSSYPFRMPDFFTDLDREFSLKLIDLWASFVNGDGKMPNLEDNMESDKKWPVSNKYDNKPKFVQISHSYTRLHEFDFEIRCHDIWRSILV